MSPRQHCILALDCGSTNFKAAVFDPSLHRLGECSAPLRYIVRGPKRVEFDPEVAWRISVQLIRKVCAQAGLSTEAVCRVVLTSQANTFCALDRAGQPLIPFMSWQDQRAYREAALLNRRLGSSFHQNCAWPRAAPGLQAAMLLWLKSHQPQCLNKTVAIVTLPGFLAMRLGMPNSVDPNLAAMSGLYSLKTARWWKPMLKICGVNERQLPALVPLGRSLGTNATCRDLVLAKRTKVILAGNDQTAGAFGNFCSKQHVLVTLGTALVVYRFMGRKRGPYTADGCWGPYPGGAYYELATRNHGCAALDWARRRLTPGRNIQFFTELAKKALLRRKKRVAFQAGTLFYPDAMNTRRAWVGSPELAARALSVFEGIGFALKQMIEDELRVPLPLPEVRVVGGGSVNAFWLQLLADILDTCVVRGTGDALFGAALQAGPRAMKRFYSAQALFKPRTAGAYQARYQRWKHQHSRHCVRRQQNEKNQ